MTSLVDFVGFRGKRDSETVDELEARIDAAIGNAAGQEVDSSRVFVYVQRHEFEGLLFSGVEVFRTLPDISTQQVADLRSIRDGFTTPEDINDNPQTAPSRRIVGVVPGYRKRTYGPLLAQEIGLVGIRSQCPRFDAWVKRLESLAAYRGS